MIITIDNIKSKQEELGRSIVEKARYINPNKKRGFLSFLLALLFENPKYILLKEIRVRLRDGRIITIPKGFIWDLSSVPRFLWWLFPPDGDFEFASLIHDYLYWAKIMSRERADVEMFDWSKAVAGTTGKNTWSDVDNWIRYAYVRILGWVVYYRKK